MLGNYRCRVHAHLENRPLWTGRENTPPPLPTVIIVDNALWHELLQVAYSVGLMFLSQCCTKIVSVSHHEQSITTSVAPYWERSFNLHLVRSGTDVASSLFSYLPNLKTFLSLKKIYFTSCVAKTCFVFTKCVYTFLSVHSLISTIVIN